jgi:hypothetical protein
VAFAFSGISRTTIQWSPMRPFRNHNAQVTMHAISDIADKNIESRRAMPPLYPGGDMPHLAAGDVTANYLLHVQGDGGGRIQLAVPP